MGLLQIKKATRQSKKIKMALIGVAGSGKTYSALQIAKGLGEKVLLIDSEHGSASAYADLDFDTAELESFSPQNYVDAIREAEQAGYDVLIIDSLSHAWTGKDGALEQVDRAGRRSQSGNSFAAWRDVTPMHNAMIDAIVGAKVHIIATLRAKTEYIVEQGKNGKSAPRKVGMAPVQRDGLEYEFDVVGEIDNEHYLSISKSRCLALSDQVIHLPGEQVAKVLRDWLSSAAPATPASVPVLEGGGVDKDGVVWCDCGLKARHVRGKSGKGWVCGETPAYCSFKMKDDTPDEPEEETQSSEESPTTEPDAPVEAEVVAPEEPAPSGDVTEAQMGCILAIGGKVFRSKAPAELEKLAGKPIGLLTKEEASALIDKVRQLSVNQRVASTDIDKPNELTKAVRGVREAATAPKTQNPLVQAFCIKAQEKGLPWDDASRDNRLDACNRHLVSHGHKTITSTNDADDDALRCLLKGLEDGDLFWMAPEVAEQQAA